ncbi:hypothetical protein PAHAL_3G083400 [Panicum hallii]|jgi:hypothetical protein|uniref:Rapid alkalinization factor 1 n=1 Tax=Panicum hallii TaxID=206008 RepID=A0A2S3H774_9POAL|nr:protein RALF-like 19 [Panicum hallii]PAN16752.1 hypothetical protein PAHAL_3G083400 [Panicum hallii]
MARLDTASLVALAAFFVLCCAASSAAAQASMTADLGAMQASPSCDRALGQCAVGSDEEDEYAELGGGEASLRRAMAQRQPTNRYISYAALRADQVPCNQRGRSYYSNCASQQPANPYRRGCSAITRCARNTN